MDLTLWEKHDGFNAHVLALGTGLTPDPALQTRAFAYLTTQSPWMTVHCYRCGCVHTMRQGRALVCPSCGNLEDGSEPATCGGCGRRVSR